MAGRSSVKADVTVAMIGSGALIAQQVGGKATRDALFLSTFDITALPIMLSVSALFSIIIVLWVSRTMARSSPGRIIPPIFVLSGVLQLILWPLSASYPELAAIVLYLHIAGFGSVLVSGFWSMYNERFDPRTAKKYISRVAGGATLGGLAGGLLAERVAALATLPSMLPLMALMHLFCAWALRSLIPPPSTVRSKKRSGEEKTEPVANGFQVLKRVPYLRNLALLILIGTISAALIDYVFKAQAAATFDSGEDLMRFFATFYVAVSLVTFLVQTLATRRVLEGVGLSNTVASLPLATGLGAFLAFLVPGLGTLGVARGAEAMFRSSFFRSGYELFFTPIAEADKRATKSIIDVGFERMGDALGGAIVRLLLFLGPALATPFMLALAAVLSVVGLIVTRVLHGGYVASLEKSLVSRALELDLSIVSDRTTRNSMLQTMTSFNLRDHLAEAAHPKTAAAPSDAEPTRPVSLQPEAETLPAAKVEVEIDPFLRDVSDLRSGDSDRITAVLDHNPIMDPVLAGHVIPLLAWDRLSDRVIQGLQNIAPRITGQLLDVLLDKKQEFAIRRRVPRVLVVAATQRTADGLLVALGDRRFEVRFQCGRALALIHNRNPRIEFDQSKIYKQVLQEVDVDRRIWESQRLLDRSDEAAESVVVDDYLRDRTSRSLEHVFTVLSLILPKEPLKIAFKGLHTDDPKLVGTALEYLESVLPPKVREKLWPFLEEPAEHPVDQQRSRDEILSDLMKSNQSIEISLTDLRKQIEESGGIPKPEESSES